jgi:hypothetical protein
MMVNDVEGAGRVGGVVKGDGELEEPEVTTCPYAAEAALERLLGVPAGSEAPFSST